MTSTEMCSEYADPVLRLDDPQRDSFENFEGFDWSSVSLHSDEQFKDHTTEYPYKISQECFLNPPIYVQALNASAAVSRDDFIGTGGSRGCNIMQTSGSDGSCTLFVPDSGAQSQLKQCSPLSVQTPSTNHTSPSSDLSSRCTVSPECKFTWNERNAENEIVEVDVTWDSSKNGVGLHAMNQPGPSEPVSDPPNLPHMEACKETMYTFCPILPMSVSPQYTSDHYGYPLNAENGRLSANIVQNGSRFCPPPPCLGCDDSLTCSSRLDCLPNQLVASNEAWGSCFTSEPNITLNHQQNVPLTDRPTRPDFNSDQTNFSLSLPPDASSNLVNPTLGNPRGCPRDLFNASADSCCFDLLNPSSLARWNSYGYAQPVASKDLNSSYLNLMTSPTTSMFEPGSFDCGYNPDTRYCLQTPLLATYVPTCTSREAPPPLYSASLVPWSDPAQGETYAETHGRTQARPRHCKKRGKPPKSFKSMAHKCNFNHPLMSCRYSMPRAPKNNLIYEVAQTSRYHYNGFQSTGETQQLYNEVQTNSSNPHVSFPFYSEPIAESTPLNYSYALSASSSLNPLTYPLQPGSTPHESTDDPVRELSSAKKHSSDIASIPSTLDGGDSRPPSTANVVPRLNLSLLEKQMSSWKSRGFADYGSSSTPNTSTSHCCTLRASGKHVQSSSEIPGVYFDKKKKGFRVRFQNVYVGWVSLSLYSSYHAAHEVAKQIWKDAVREVTAHQNKQAAVKAGIPLQIQRRLKSKNPGGRPRTVSRLTPMIDAGISNVVHHAMANPRLYS